MTSLRMLARIMVSGVLLAACSGTSSRALLPSGRSGGTAESTEAPRPVATSSATPTAASAGTSPPSLLASSSPGYIPIKDGEPWIVYQSPYDPDGDGVPGNGTYLIRPDGRDQHLLLTSQAGHPDWSPDGKQIAVEAEPADGSTRIWTLKANGTDTRDLIPCTKVCTAVAAPAWSPDGKQMAFQRYLTAAAAGYLDDRIALEVLDIATGATRIVAMTPVAGSEYVEYVGPRWSPDGKRITFTVNRFATPPADDNLLASAIGVVKADGSELDTPRILTDQALWAAAPDWSPDGQRIVFNSYPINYFEDATKASNLYTIGPDGTRLEQVTRFGENETRATRPSWTSDGNRIIFTHIARESGNGWGDRKIGFIEVNGSDLTLVPSDGWAWLGRLRPTP